MSLNYGYRWVILASFLALGLGLASLLLAQDNPSAPPNGSQVTAETALGDLVHKYLAAYAEKNLDGMTARWSAKSPHLAALQKEAREFFGANQDIKVNNLRVEKVRVEGQKAHVRVAFELSAVDSKTHQPAADLGPTVRALDCVQEGDAWKIWRDVDAIQGLGELLIAAKNESERTELLTQDGDLVTPELAQELIHQGEARRSQGNLPNALIAFQSAQQVAEKAADELGLCAALLNIGIVQDMLGNSRAALESFGKSLKIAEAHDDKLLIARARLNRGDAYLTLGQPKEALADFTKSLELAESLKKTKGVAVSLHNIGEVNVLLGNHAEAMNFFERALATLEADGSDKADIARELLGIGVVYLRQGNNAVALEYFRRSLAALGPSGDKEIFGHLLDYIGQVYETQGDYEQALTYYRKSLAVSEAMSNDRDRGVATALENIGIAEEGQGAYAAATADFQKSLGILDKIGMKGGILAVLSNLGEVEYLQGHFAEALEYQNKSQAMAESLGDQENLGQGAAIIARIYSKQHKFDEALNYARRATEIAERISSRDLLWQAHEIAGIAQESLGQTEQARQSFLDAISTVELLRTQVAGGEEQQQSFFSSKLGPYHDMVDLLVSQTKPSEAFAYAERAKGRALLDVMQSGKVQVAKAMTPGEREREQQMQAEMVSLNKQMEQENGAEAPDPKRVADLKGHIESARLEYNDFQTSLFAAHPELKTQRGQVQPVSLQEAVQLLPDSKSAFLEFVTGEEKTYLFVLTRKDETDRVAPELKIYALPVAYKELKRKAERFRDQLGRRDLTFRSLSADLFRSLIKPAEAQLADKDTLVIVPDGPLWNLPFQALLQDNNHYLLERYAISYAPSLTVLREMMRVHQKRRPETPAPQTTTLLAMANPVLGKETIRRAAVAYRGDTLGPLPEAQREAVALKQLYGNDQSEVYTGADAGEDRFKAEAGKFRVLHLATHGIFNDANPMYSHILLSAGKADSKDDGLLEAWEIMQMDLQADLAVLSACETGRGRVSAGEGVIGLTWAFFVAGVPTTVVSQWKVESASTAKLMLGFHRTLRTADVQHGSTFATARALQRAEMQLLHSQQYAHPFYWAGFVLVGDPQ
jgi:CHAT domain-containing protein/Tfp pilus assembly protein PilF